MKQSMMFNRNPELWTSAILHLAVFVALLVVTLVETFLPKEQPHVFEMVSEPLSSEDPQQSTASSEPIPDLSLPDVQPLEIPEPVVSQAVPVRQPVEQPVEPAKPKEQLISYADFIKDNPVKQPKPRKLQPSRPTVNVPTINTEKFGINLQSSLTTTDANVSSTLTSAERTALQRYGDQLNRRLNQAWIKPDNFAGKRLVVTVVFDVNRYGHISNIRFNPGSGNATFDKSVMTAFKSVSSGGITPTGKGHTFTMSFKIVE